MSTRKKGESNNEDEHPAPSAYNHQGQAHFGNMALVADQQAPQGFDHVFGYGDFQYGPDVDLGTPPDGPPVLTNSDQSILSNFFSDPNGLTSNLIPYDTGLPHDHEAANGGYPWNFGNGTMSTASGGSGSGSLHHKTHVNGSNAPFGHTDHWLPQQSQHMNADDISAASTIHNLKSPGPIPNYSNIQLVGGISGVWGNFAMPTPMQTNQIPQIPGQPQLRAVPTQTRHHSFTYPTQPLFTQNQIYMPQSEGVHGPAGRPRHMSSSEQPTPQWPGYQQQQQQYQAIPFGTDSSFSGPRYQSDQAAKRPQGYPTMADQKQNGAHGQGNGKSPVNGSSAAQWGSMTPATRKQDEAEFEEPRDRKRRKSQMDGHAEVDYSYQKRPAENAGINNEQAYERRESTIMGPPDSPDGHDGSRRSKKKMRETLTDAEKRAHHIMSEKKRRELINGGFKELENMVPCLQAGKSGLSRSEVLQEIASYLETLKTGNIKLTGELQRFGLDTTATMMEPMQHIKTEEGAIINAYGT